MGYSDFSIQISNFVAWKRATFSFCRLYTEGLSPYYIQETTYGRRF